MMMMVDDDGDDDEWWWWWWYDDDDGADDDGNCYPIGHLMCIRETMVVVEDHDGGDDARSHHEHDAIEIGAWQVGIMNVLTFWKVKTSEV